MQFAGMGKFEHDLAERAVVGGFDHRMVDVARLELASVGKVGPLAEHLEQEAARAALGYATGESGRVVAYVDQTPVGSAGLTLTNGVARLWGGAVLEQHRRRGIYRALLDERMSWAVEQRARLALVKGRVETSAPILRRSGFTVYGRERSYRLPVPSRGL